MMVSQFYNVWFLEFVYNLVGWIIWNRAAIFSDDIGAGDDLVET